MNLFNWILVVLILSATLSTEGQDYGNYDYGNGQYGGAANANGNYSGYYGAYGNYSGQYGAYGNYSGYYGNYSNYYGNYSYYDMNGTNSNVNLQPLPEPNITVLTELSGVITSPGYPNETYPDSTYPSNAHFVWYREGKDDTLVQFKIWDLGIEIGEGNSNVSCDFDYLNVSVTSIGWKRYCGYVTPPDEIQGMGSLRLQLVSDATANFWGFTSSYRVVEKFDPCEPNPCGNGKCTVEELLPVCVCEAGYTGEQCTINIKECESDPCENGGTCDEKDQVDSYKCRCTEYYHGTHCETAKPLPCETTPCQNNGTCEDMGIRRFRCFCQDDYVGVRCERRKGDPIQQKPVRDPQRPPNMFGGSNDNKYKPKVPKGSKSEKPKSSASLCQPTTALIASILWLFLLTV